MVGHQRAVGTFATHREAEVALRELRESGFAMDHVSIVGRDGDNLTDRGKQLAEDTEATEKAKTGAVAGGALGGLTGLLVGLGALAIPGIGPVMAGGALATALATTAAGGAIGAATGGLVGGLVGLGIPEDRARVYNDRVSRGEYLVMVEGSDTEIRQAERILSQRGIQEWGIFAAPAAQRATAPVGMATESGAPAGTLYPTDAPVTSMGPGGTLYPTDAGSINPAAAQTSAPAGTLYPSGTPARSTGGDFPAGTLYPEGTPDEDQVGKDHDPLK